MVVLPEAITGLNKLSSGPKMSYRNVLRVATARIRECKSGKLRVQIHAQIKYFTQNIFESNELAVLVGLGVFLLSRHSVLSQQNKTKQDIYKSRSLTGFHFYLGG